MTEAPQSSNFALPKDGRLTEEEIYWRDHQQWLQASGYMLRPRFAPDWTPSWIKTGKLSLLSEDGPRLLNGQVVDACSTKDGASVALKKISKSDHPYEEEISMFLSSDPLKSDPRNHCVPVLDRLHPPDDENILILVLPFLRQYDSPRFDTFGEVIDCFRQLFEGLRFLHTHHVAHRDINSNNVMYDGKAMYPDGYHPLLITQSRDLSASARHYTRTQLPPRYYLIDFGISRRYNPEDGPPLEPPITGGDPTVPEFLKSDEPQNPFPTDVYYMGNMIRQEFLEGHPIIPHIRGRKGFEFMKHLVNDMVQDDPSKRPTMDEVVTRFDGIVKHLSSWKLRSRVVKRTDTFFDALYHGFKHWKRRIAFFIKRVPAIPHA